MSLLFSNKINGIIKLDLCIIQVIPNITWSFLATCKKRGLQLNWKTFSFYFSLCVFAVYAVCSTNQRLNLLLVMAKYKSMKLLLVLGLMSH